VHLTDWAQRIDLGEEIQEVYLHSFLFKLGVKLVSIFLPLYILGLGYPIETVILFFMVYYAVYIFASLPCARLASIIGYKHTSLLSSPFILAFYLSLRALPESSLLIYPVAVLGGFSGNLYWMGMNPEVATSSHSEEREKEAGFFFSMPSLASILSPMVGGVILAFSGFPVLFLVTSIIIGTSFLPFLFSKEHHEGMDYSPIELAKKLEAIDFMTYTIKGFNSMGRKVLWPLYLAVIIQGSVNIGGAGSFLSLGSAVTSITLGKIVNDENRTKVILVGTLVAALTYILMASVTSPSTAFLISAINGLSYTAITLTVYSKAMDHAEKEDLVEYFAFREMALSAGRVSILLVFLGLFTLFSQTNAFIYSFVVISLAVIGTGILASRMN